MLVSLLLAASIPAAASLQCDNIVADGHRFNFDKLKGPHSVVTSEFTPPTYKNTTYTIDLCGPLKRKGDVPKGEECPNGTWICAIKHSIKGDHDDIDEVRPIAGNLRDHGGKDLDFVATRLKTSDSTSDSQKDGVRLVLKGGKYPLASKERASARDQKAIIELICDPNKEGTEGEWKAEDAYESSLERFKYTARNAEGEGEGEGDKDAPGDGEHQLKNPDATLIWDSYGPDKSNGDIDVLRLTWYTKYACESSTGDGGKPREHWGFFTWLVILVFLATASYLIFGSWLNYNRYGARGWDLLPHGDTIRDVPYLLKDWIRRLINTVQGSGSRGGYSAV